jgi:hypothetical protein
VLICSTKQKRRVTIPLTRRQVLSFDYSQSSM